MIQNLLFNSVNPRMRNGAWREALQRPLPGRWKRIIARRLEEFDRTNHDWKTGNVFLRDIVQGYAEAVLPLDATLDDIRTFAALRATDAYDLTGRFKETSIVVGKLEAMCERWHVNAPQGVTPGGLIARLCDPSWWASRLIRMHSQKIESGAICLGLVSGRADKYVSNENLRRREAQNARNAAMLERTHAVNEDGEIFTLAQLSDKTVANPAIRRGEMMLRMRGMEEIGDEFRCAVDWAVITAPSRFHATRANGIANPKYDNSTPKDTHNYLQDQWKKCRTWLAHRGVEYYGMRTVEAHQDGTPHWNIMVFIKDPDHRKTWRQAITRYFLLNDSPDEKGAAQRRVKFDAVTKEKGGASAYIAKYISKNIDGVGIEHDLYGDPIITTTRRVSAWSKTWRIKQFQPIGCPPVGVWRELRRIEEGEAMRGPENLQRAWRAAQRLEGGEDGESKRADYAEYIRAYGGPFVKRKHAQLWLHKQQQKGLGKYGEPLGERTAGVVARGAIEVDKGGIVGVIKVAGTHVAEGVHREWTIVRSAGANGATSRTCVNNCTRPDAEPVFDHNAAAPIDADFDGAARNFAGGGAFRTDRRPE
ncbi:replication endonuclease [Paraburkholderia bannensis]|nr:replication endonuclease [Paraburkholderia bannensis]RQM46548.1 replication endonuclease [Paraburkholderia bannensis]